MTHVNMWFVHLPPTWSSQAGKSGNLGSELASSGVRSKDTGQTPLAQKQIRENDVFPGPVVSFDAPLG